MKIGIDCHNLEIKRTGTGRYLMNLLRYWAKENAEFVLYFKNQIPEDIPASKNFQKKNLKTNSNALFMHYFLPKAAKKDRIDILFCPNYIAPVFYKGDIALALHDIIYEARPDLYNWPSIFDRILLKKASKISAKKAKIILTCSEFSKSEIIKHYKVDSKKVFVIYPAADEKFKKIEHAASKKKFMLYVGDIIKRRFVPETIRAFDKISNKLPGYKFLIIGKNRIGQQIKGDKIIHKDYVSEDDLVLLYNTADLFVWLSSYEGFGFPPLEAMACGTPVLSTKKTSLAEVLGDYPIWVENPEDVDEISDKMLKILKDENLRNEMINRGLVQAQKFSWEKTAEKTLQTLLN
jgi:glycosyltransferase involved in cell wall biosynthesis